MVLLMQVINLYFDEDALLGCFMVVTFLIFSQGDWLFDIFMGVEINY